MQILQTHDFFRNPNLLAFETTILHRFCRSFPFRLASHLSPSKKVVLTGGEVSRVRTYFQPVVLESQGGMAHETAGVIHKIVVAVATAENREPAVVREEMVQRIALIIARAGAAAMAQRRAYKLNVTVWGVSQAVGAARLLQEP